MSGRVAVAGGSGFIGAHVVAALAASGREVVVLSRRPGAGEGVACDVTEPIDPGLLAGCDAVVNLVGIARESGRNTFERVHVEAVRNLIVACRVAGIRRLVHVGVVDVPGTGGPYRDSKRAGEELVRASDLEWTVLRPGLVVGPGDQALTNLVRTIGLAPIFPVPTAAGALQLVDVRDVADAVVRALEREAANGRVLDVVGPERLDLAALARRVGDALGLRVWTPPLPRALLGAIAAIGERWLTRPLLTRAQLDMLCEGLVGDPEPARRELGLVPRAVDRSILREHAASVRPLPLPALRIVTGDEHREWLRSAASAMGRVGLALPLLVAVMIGLPGVLPDVWTRMAAILVPFAAFAVFGVRLPWRSLARVRAADVGVGIALATLLWASSLLVLAAASSIAPTEVARLDLVWAWGDRLPPASLVVALASIVVLEDVVWRGMVALPLAAKLGPWVGTGLGAALFATAHVTTGPPLLILAAFGCGWVWNLCVVRTRRLVPVVVAHLGFDLAVVLTHRLSA